MTGSVDPSIMTGIEVAWSISDSWGPGGPGDPGRDTKDPEDSVDPSYPVDPGDPGRDPKDPWDLGSLEEFHLSGKARLLNSTNRFVYL